MNVDDAMEAAKAYLTFEQEGEPMFASEQVAVVLAAEVERLRAELAEAKAASVCPVEVIDCYFNAMPDLGDVRLICKSGADAQAVTDWLRERMKERGE